MPKHNRQIRIIRDSQPGEAVYANDAGGVVRPGAATFVGKDEIFTVLDEDESDLIVHWREKNKVKIALSKDAIDLWIDL